MGGSLWGEGREACVRPVELRKQKGEGERSRGCWGRSGKVRNVEADVIT